MVPHVESENKEKLNSLKERVERWSPGAGGWRKWGDAGERGQNLSYWMSKFWGFRVQHRDYSNNTVLYT